MKAICTDMAAEQQELDAIVAGLDDPGWNIMTPADGWDIREQIRHLAYYENRARLAASEKDLRDGRVRRGGAAELMDELTQED